MVSRTKTRTAIAVAFGMCGALMASSVGAATITWDFTSGGWTETNPGNFGNTASKIVSGVQATASAWSDTVNATNTQIENAYLGLYSGGLGVTNRDGTNDTTGCPGSGGTSNDRCEGSIGNTQSPEHSIDNNERTDAVRIQFGSQVNLTSLILGYVSGDADITVLASNGAALSGKNYAVNATGLLAAGWNFIGNYANIAEGSLKSIPNTTYATDWLIIAYNPAFGTGTNLQSGDDFFKVKLVTGNTRQVPEPGTLLLLGIALAGLYGRRAVRRL
jgi:PEP-CTERM motif